MGGGKDELGGGNYSPNEKQTYAGFKNGSSSWCVAPLVPKQTDDTWALDDLICHVSLCKINFGLHQFETAITTLQQTLVTQWSKCLLF